MRPGFDRRWWMLVAVAGVLQAGFVFLLGDRSIATPRSTATEPRIVLAPAADPDTTALADPTLFAWDGPRGFSAEAWLRISPPAHRPPQFTELQRSLQLQPTDLTPTARLLDSSEAKPPVLALAKAFPTAPPSTSALTETTVPTNSFLAVAAPLDARLIAAPITLPSWPFPDVLPPSFVRVRVDARGAVQSVTLLESCGLAAADQRAVETAHDLRFAPLVDAPSPYTVAPAGPMIAGEVEFHWHTVPPPAN